MAVEITFKKPSFLKFFNENPKTLHIQISDSQSQQKIVFIAKL